MSGGTLDALALHAAEFLLPLEAALADADDFRAFVADLGWDLPEGAYDLAVAVEVLAALIEEARALAAVLEGAGGDPLLIADATAGVLVALADTIRALRPLAEALATSGLLPPDYLAATAIVEEFPRRLLATLLIDYLQGVSPLLLALLLLVGAVEFVRVPADPARYQTAHLRPILRLDRLSRLLSDPRGLLAEVYGWGTPAFDHLALLGGIGGVAVALGGRTRLRPLPARGEGKLLGTPSAPGGGQHQLAASLIRGLPPLRRLDAGFTAFGLRPTDPGGADGGIGFAPYVVGSGELAFPLTDTAALIIDAAASVRDGVALLVRPDQPAQLRLGVFGGTPATAPSGRLGVGLRLTPEGEDEPLQLLALSARNRLVAYELSVLVGAAATATGGGPPFDPYVEVSILDGQLRVAAEPDDALLGEVTPSEGLGLQFSLGFGWSQARGFYLQDGVGLAVSIPVAFGIPGLVRVDEVALALEPTADAVAGALTVSMVATLGPISLLLQGTGLALRLGFPDEGGNLGVADFRLGFRPPQSIGIGIDTGAAFGSGVLYLDPERGHYAGVLTLAIAGKLQVTAFGLLATRLPDGGKTFSLLISITAEGFAPIPLPLGLRLDAIGGLLGVHRTVATDYLQAGLASGALGAVLFPQDLARDPLKVLKGIDLAFPAARGRFIFGPVFRLAWGKVPNVRVQPTDPPFTSLVSAEIALLLELPDPVRLILLGQLVSALPNRAMPVILVQIDILGTLDFAARSLAIDAVLRQSHLGPYALTGGLALRATWGATPSFLLAVGGFHPRFTPPPAFPALDRLAIGLSNDGASHLRLEAYLAVTANTIQFGALLDVAVGAAGFVLKGLLSFDTLIQLSPFRFTANILGMVALLREGTTLLAVQLAVALSGPGPWHIRGQATFQIAFLSCSVNFERSFGTAIPAIPPPPPAIEAQLAAALRDPDNWHERFPADRGPGVTVRRRADVDTLWLHPGGDLAVAQGVVPLGEEIGQFGGVALPVAQSFALREISLAGEPCDATLVPLDEFFAPGQFLALGEDEKLARPSFERMQAGVQLGLDRPAQGRAVEVPIAYETLIIDDEWDAPPLAGPAHRPAAALVRALAHREAGEDAARPTGPRRFRAVGDRIACAAPRYVIAPTDRLTAPIAAGLHTPPVATQGAVRGALARYLRDHPDERGRYQIVRAEEVARR